MRPWKSFSLTVLGLTVLVGDTWWLLYQAVEGELGLSSLLASAIFLLVLAAISLRWMHETAAALLGAVAVDAGQPGAAVSHLQRAIELDGSYGQAFFFLGLAQKMLGQPAEAIVALEQALALTQDAAMRARIRDYLEELYAANGQDGAHRRDAAHP